MWTHTYTQLLPVELLTAPLGSRLAGSAYGYRPKDVPVRLRLQSVRQASYIQCGLLVHSDSQPHSLVAVFCKRMCPATPQCYLKAWQVY